MCRSSSELGSLTPAASNAAERRVIHRQDPAFRIEQHHGVGQCLQRRFERVLRPDDLADIRAAKFGEVERHLIERRRQLAELVSRRDLDPLVEAAFTDRVGASRETPQRAHDASSSDATPPARQSPARPA